MQYTIEGQIAQFARVEMEAGQAVWASHGTLMSYTPGVNWDMKMPGGASGMARRLLSGEGLSLLYLTADRPGETVLLGSDQPGHLIAWDLADGPILTTRGSFLAAAGERIDINVTVAKRPGAALFGGAGLFLQRISGSGTVLIHGSGDFDDRRLAEGERLFVSSGNLAAFADAIDYDIQTVGNLKRVLFSGEGLFMTRLTGPGRVLLQSMERRRLAAARSS